MLASVCILLFALAAIASIGAMASTVKDHAADIRALRLQRSARDSYLTVTWRIREAEKPDHDAINASRPASLVRPALRPLQPCQGWELGLAA